MMSPQIIQAGTASGINGQTMNSIKVNNARKNKTTNAARSTKNRIIKPMKRLKRLSFQARQRSTKLAPGYVMIRFQGANNVCSSCFTENSCKTDFIRCWNRLPTFIQPEPYHQAKKELTSITTIVTLVAYWHYCSTIHS